MYKYLLATDGSENSLRAARHLLAIAKKHSDAEITAITVYNFQPYIGPEIQTSLQFDQLLEVAQNQARTAMDKTTAIFKEAGIEVKEIIKEGEPGPTIAETANALGTNQIVMGARGIGAVKELFMGSVSRKVVSLSDCPVTLVK